MQANVLGIIGGGQLGRMLTISAKSMGFEVYCVDPTPNCPASQVGAKQIVGDLSDDAALTDLFEVSDVVTWEIEHIDVSQLRQVSTGSSAIVRPSISDLAMIQDKLAQKQALVDDGIPVAEFRSVETADQIADALEHWGGLVVKSRKGGFDGRGNFVVRSPDQISDCLELLGKDLYAEQMVDFDREVSVIIVKGVGDTAVFEVVDTVHSNNICESVTMPSSLAESQKLEALEIAAKVSGLLDGPGVYAIEMFVVGEAVLVNEIAPRVHNSGHLTIEACASSQFEQHVRAVMGLPLGSTQMVCANAAMVNILGRVDTTFEPSSVADVEDVKLHWYGKSPVKLDRKMGHITAIGDESQDVLLKRCSEMREKLDI